MALAKTAAFGEHQGATDTGPSAPEQDLVSDCLGVCHVAENGLACACSPRRPQAVLWRQALMPSSVRWTKAHTAEPSAEDELAHPDSWRDWRGNWLADALAKLGAGLHRSPPEALQAAHRLHADTKLFVSHFGQVLANFQPFDAAEVAEERARMEQAPADPPPRPHEEQHVWEARARGWQCAHCGETWCPTSGSGCPLYSHTLAKVVGAPKRHALVGFRREDGLSRLACTRCGTYATKVARHLGDRCRGVPAHGTQSWAQRHDLRSGRMPGDRRLRIVALWTPSEAGAPRTTPAHPAGGRWLPAAEQPVISDNLLEMVARASEFLVGNPPQQTPSRMRQCQRLSQLKPSTSARGGVPDGWRPMAAKWTLTTFWTSTLMRVPKPPSWTSSA